jgi:hypothetical protein
VRGERGGGRGERERSGGEEDAAEEREQRRGGGGGEGLVAEGEQRRAPRPRAAARSGGGGHPPPPATRPPPPVRSRAPGSGLDLVSGARLEAHVGTVWASARGFGFDDTWARLGCCLAHITLGLVRSKRPRLKRP